MSLQLGAALKRGATQLVSRSGAVIVLAYAATMLVYQLSFNTLLQPALSGLTPPGVEAPSTGLVTLPVPGAVAGGLLALSLLVVAVVGVVAVRTFVARERDHIPRRFLTERLPFVVVNLLVGGVVFGLVVLLGTVLLVVPGIVAYLGLLFMVQFVAVENVNFVTAMRRSWRLTRGNWLRLFVLLAVLVATVFVLTFAVNVGVGLALGSAGAGAGVAGLVVAMVNVLTTLYLLAVLSDAFVQLRDGEPSTQGQRPTVDPLGA
jgi:hypothetical protein